LGSKPILKSHFLYPNYRNATSERLCPHFYRENIGNKIMMNIGTWLHAYIIENEGVKTIHFKQQCIWQGRRNKWKSGGASSIIFRHNMPSPGWNRVKRSDKLGGRSSPLPPQVPTTLYGKTTIKFDWLLIANPFLMVSSLRVF